MANGVTYGINFPFNDSLKGDYLSLSQNPDQEIRSNLIHLILTRKGSRYYLPDFGTKIYEFIEFDPTEIQDHIIILTQYIIDILYYRLPATKELFDTLNTRIAHIPIDIIKHKLTTLDKEFNLHKYMCDSNLC